MLCYAIYAMLCYAEAEQRRVWAKLPSDADVVLTHGPPHNIG